MGGDGFPIETQAFERTLRADRHVDGDLWLVRPKDRRHIVELGPVAAPSDVLEVVAQLAPRESDHRANPDLVSLGARLTRPPWHEVGPGWEHAPTPFDPCKNGG